jgi:FkbM family methyltransferase
MKKNEILKNILGNDGKIKIPEWVKKVKLDIGTSLSAPNSELWLQRETELLVFGFEPNIYNIKTIYDGQDFWPHHIEKERIDNTFFVINCALSDKNSDSEKFYCTGNNNSGTSSLFEPKSFEIVDIIDVPVITLNDFFDCFPWEKIPFIDQIKIDAQSSDFNIIKGMDKYMKDRVVYVDVETSTNGQYYSEENPSELKNYMENNGFQCLSWGLNATFVNNKFKDKFKIKIIYFSYD